MRKKVVLNRKVDASRKRFQLAGGLFPSLRDKCFGGLKLQGKSGEGFEFKTKVLFSLRWRPQNVPGT